MSEGVSPVHQEDKSNQCSGCGKVYAYHPYLLLHLKGCSKHKQLTTTTTTTTATTTTTTTITTTTIAISDSENEDHGDDSDYEPESDEESWEEENSTFYGDELKPHDGHPLHFFDKDSDSEDISKGPSDHKSCNDSAIMQSHHQTDGQSIELSTSKMQKMTGCSKDDHITSTEIIYNDNSVRNGEDVSQKQFENSGTDGLTTVHPGKGNTKPTVASTTSKKLLPCPYCQRRFTLQRLLNNHVAIHSGVKNYSCDVCQKKFFTSLSRKKHIRRIHTGITHICSTCSIAFSSENDLKQHSCRSSRLNAYEQSNPAPSCSKTKHTGLVTVCESRLEREIQTVGSETHDYQIESVQERSEQKDKNHYDNAFHEKSTAVQSELSCTLNIQELNKESQEDNNESNAIIMVPLSEVDMECKVIISPIEESRIRKNTRGKKSRRCDICSKTFTLRSSLLRHLKLHTGVKRFQCPVCRRMFGRKDHMQSHARKCHVSNLCEMPTKAEDGEDADDVEEVEDVGDVEDETCCSEKDDNDAHTAGVFRFDGNELLREKVKEKDLQNEEREDVDTEMIDHIETKEQAENEEKGEKMKIKQVEERKVAQEEEKVEGEEEKSGMNNKNVASREENEALQNADMQVAAIEKKATKRIFSSDSQISGCAKDAKMIITRYKCNLCNRSFSRRDSLRRHLKNRSCANAMTVNKKGESFACDKCERIFRNKKTFKNHLRMHDGERLFTCNTCGKKFLWKSELLRHKCRSNHAKKMNLAVHVSDKLNAKCTETNTKPRRESNKDLAAASDSSNNQDPMNMQIDGDEGENSLKGDTINIEENQQGNRDDSSSNRSHNEGNQEKKPASTGLAEDSYICPTCGKPFSSAWRLKYHIVIHTGIKNFQCDVCMKTFSKDSQRKHIRKTHGFLLHKSSNAVRLSSERSLKKEVCHQSNTSKVEENLDKNKSSDARSISEDRERVNDENDKGDKPTSSTGIEVPDELPIIPHHTHSDNPPCTNNQTLATDVSNDNHAAGEQSHKCVLCMKYFSTRGNLRKHQLRTHSSSQSTLSLDRTLTAPSSKAIQVTNLKQKRGTHVCPICYKGLSARSNLIQHMRIHYQAQQYECERCTKKFLYKDSLRRHVKLKHCSDNNYSAEPSGKGKTSNLKTISTHENSKIKEKRDCKNGVARKDSVQIHLQVVHSLNTNANSNNMSQEQHISETCASLAAVTETKDLEEAKFDSVEVHNPPIVTKQLFKSTKESPFERKGSHKQIRCNTCDKLFTGRDRKRSLRRHLVLHTGIKPFECPICQSKFARSDYLKRHMGLHKDNSLT